jgi:predicted esterase
VVCATFAPAAAQSYLPPPSKPPSEEKLKEIDARMTKLRRLLDSLRRQGVHDPYLADVEIYHKAAAWIIRHNEYYQAEAGDWTLEALNHGLLRGQQLAQGEAPWLQATGQTVIRAYRSAVDGSVQPYAVTLPAGYGADATQKWRVDVVLHGRDPSLTEVKFLHQHAEQPAPKEQNFVQIDIFGRGNNAYRWAGESDILEVQDHFTRVENILRRDHLIDPLRVVLRGFSMGGAGTWHLGLHMPHRWCVLGPGAGFTTTHGYVQDLPEKLPPQQEACLHIYDAVDYAENAYNVPVVAYAGENDPQLQAARLIEARLKPLGIPMKLLVGPGLGHEFPPEWQKKAEAAYAPFVAKGQQDFPAHVRFVTYTLRYPRCSWVELGRLDHHYQRASVDAERADTGYTIKTANVRALRLNLEKAPFPLTVTINDQTLTPRPYLTSSGQYHLYLERRGEKWDAVLPQKLAVEHQRKPQKRSRLQGPIDDAFMEGFLCVQGTGTAWHEATQKYADETLKRFQEEWDKFMRGTLPLKRDDEVTEDDMATKHLILFGDPASNSLIGQVLDGLPLRWTKDEIKFGGKTYRSAEHVPALVYPSPLNQERYVVLNSGHTFHTADFLTTNAMLFPRLGDYAILRPAPTEREPANAEVVTSGLFDDYWQPSELREEK